jgi:hypothetical protein
MRSIVTARLWTPAVAAIVSVIAGFGTAVALAQDAPGGMYPGMMGRGAMTCRMDEHIDGDLAYLKTVLKITDAQAPQWNVFAETFRADREKRANLCKETMEQARAMKSASLLDALTMVEDQLTERLNSLRAMKGALQPLYASLSKEQKKTADEVMKGGQNF